MATEFTKGPWTYDKNFPTSVWANDVWIASTNVESVGAFGERKSNARLIAAAPELLEALKAIVQRYTELMGRDCDKHDFACCVYSAEDVIAKAEAKSVITEATR